MMKPEFDKPFDLTTARAGAPIGCINGLSVKIHNWAARGAQTLLLGEIAANNADVPATWSQTGRTQGRGDCFDLVMLPLGLIDGKPVFVGDRLEQRDRHNESWVARDAQPGDKDFSISRWPAPAKVYPETTMRHGEIFTTYADFLREIGYTSIQADSHGLVAVANAALRHAIDAGHVVPQDEHNAALCRLGEQLKGIALGDHAARDMVVAKAIRDVCISKVDKFHNRAAQELLNVDLLRIINCVQ